VRIDSPGHAPRCWGPACAWDREVRANQRASPAPSNSDRRPAATAPSALFRYGERARVGGERVRPWPLLKGIATCQGLDAYDVQRGGVRHDNGQHAPICARQLLGSHGILLMALDTRRHSVAQAALRLVRRRALRDCCRSGVGSGGIHRQPLHKRRITRSSQTSWRHRPFRCTVRACLRTALPEV